MFLPLEVTMSRRRVCLFGLSADPPTAAHVGMVVTLCQQGVFDEIRMMPVYQHQFSVSLTNRENNHDYLFNGYLRTGCVSCVVGQKVNDFALDVIYISINSCTDIVLWLSHLLPHLEQTRSVDIISTSVADVSTCLWRYAKCCDIGLWKTMLWMDHRISVSAKCAWD